VQNYGQERTDEMGFRSKTESIENVKGRTRKGVCYDVATWYGEEKNLDMKTKYLCESSKPCKYKDGEFCLAYNGKECEFRKKDRWEICYHATRTKEVAEKILREGFKPWTYFAKNLQGSIWIGEYVFAVAFRVKDMKDFWEDPWAWQFMCRDWIPPERIVALHYIKRETVYFNKSLRWFVFKTCVEHVTRRKRGKKPQHL